MRLIAVDPGQRSGVAVYDHGAIAARVITALIPPTRARTPDVVSFVATMTERGTFVVLERPTIHAIDRLKGDANDITDLSYLAGRIAGAAEAAGGVVESYLPAQWKGAVKKSIHQARIARDLERRGLAAWIEQWHAVDHNGRDALALARWWLDARGVDGGDHAKVSP